MRSPIPQVPARWFIAAGVCCVAAIPLRAQTPPLPAEAAAEHTHGDVVRALYERILERTPADAEVQSWTPYLAAGYTPRHLAHYIADSQEYRRSVPDPNAIGWITTRFRHDALGRKVAELDPARAADSTFYDPAGNVIATRGGEQREAVPRVLAVVEQHGAATATWTRRAGALPRKIRSGWPAG